MTERIHALDGVRGLAALSVVVAKLWSDLPDTWHAVAPINWAVYPPLNFLLNDRGAVVLFFILSGYVLTSSLVRPDVPVLDQFTPFLVRRLCRIWLPFAAVLCASAAIGLVLNRFGYSEPAVWGKPYWPETPNFTDLWRQLTLRYTIPPLDPPGWSLVAELLISALFPLLLVAVRQWPLAVCVAAAAANLARAPEDVQAFRFILFFVAGSFLALHRASVLATVRPLLARRPWATVVASLFGLGLAPVHWWSEWLMGAGALAVMVLALAPGSVANFLVQPWIQASGRISYSLYLTNTVVVHALGAWLSPTLSIGWILAVSVPTILLVASATYMFMENPCARLGALVARK